jgi:hypothetical protein
MHVNGFYDTGQFTTEAGPTVLRIFDLCVVFFVHDDHIARTNHLADPASDACPFINFTDHFKVLLMKARLWSGLHPAFRLKVPFGLKA